MCGHKDLFDCKCRVLIELDLLWLDGGVFQGSQAAKGLQMSSLSGLNV